jgi:hypothetical protein
LRYLRWGRDGEAVQPEKCSGVGNCLKTPQNPQRQVHALLDRMTGRKNYQTRKMFLGRGSKHSWQNNPAKKPADIMTRLRARRHNQKDHCQRNQPGDHVCP